jgi:hypothetical protein
MFTIFTIPKPFQGHIGTIQRNAMQSWTLLHPRPEIILFGNEEGTAQVAAQLGLRHEPQIASNEYGTPLLDDLFRRAELDAGSKWMCYVNADILLLSDFGRAVEHVTKSFEKFLCVSKRINLDVPEALNFSANWETTLKARCRASSKSGDHTAIDVFVFPKGAYHNVPDFGIGRLWFDQWLIKAAKEEEIPVVDLSLVAPVLHQNHDYNHVDGGRDRIWNGKEAEHNLQLYGGVKHACTLLDVTHELTADGTVRRVRLRRLAFETRHFFWDLFVRRTAGVRNALKLRKKFWQPGHSRNV